MKSHRLKVLALVILALFGSMLVADAAPKKRPISIFIFFPPNPSPNVSAV